MHQWVNQTRRMPRTGDDPGTSVYQPWTSQPGTPPAQRTDAQPKGSAEPAFRNCLKFCCDIPSFFKDGAEIQVGPLGRTGLTAWDFYLPWHIVISPNPASCNHIQLQKPSISLIGVVSHRSSFCQKVEHSGNIIKTQRTNKESFCRRILDSLARRVPSTRVLGLSPGDSQAQFRVLPPAHCLHFHPHHPSSFLICRCPSKQQPSPFILHLLRRGGERSLF